MKYLTPPNNNNTEIAPAGSFYPANYDSAFVDGYYGAAEQTSEKQFLRDLFTTLYKHWLLILSITFVVTGATIIYVAQKPDYFQTEARIQVNAENNPASGGRNGSNPIIVTNAGSDPAYFATQLQILEGSGLLRRVIKTLDLENNKNFLDPQHGRQLTVWQNVKKMIGIYKPPTPDVNLPSTASDPDSLRLNGTGPTDDEETERYAPLVAKIKRGLAVYPVRDSRTVTRETRLIDVSFTHEDPVIAAKIANAIGDAYVLQNLELKVQTNASAGDFLQKRVAELQSEIRAGEEKLINYSKANQIVSLNSGENTVVQRLSSLNQELGQAENDRITAQTAYQAALQNQMRSATADRQDSQVVALQNKLTELRQKLAQLKMEYTDEWYEVVQTKKQIDGVEHQLAGLSKRASDVQLATLKEKLDEASGRERELRAKFEQQRGDVMKQNEASINYKIIQQEIDTNKGLLDGLLQRSRENDVILNDTPNNVLVADRAVIPTAPIGPERSKNVILAFLVSLASGCGIAFLLNWLDDSVHSNEQIERLLGLPVLALVPEAPSPLSRRLLPARFNFRPSNLRSGNNYDLAAFERPEYSEAYTQLRTHLMLSRAGGPPHTILVTSGEEREGKTLTALNLAMCLAETNDRILLIDADLRCPRVDIVKGISNHVGLTTLLTSQSVTDELLDSTIRKDAVTKLNILTAGERTVNPSNLLCSQEMRDLLAKLSTRFDHIIIDSPPTLYFADSTIISTLVDSVIIVVRDNASSRESVKKVQRMLHMVGAKIVGLVLNGVPRRRTDYGRYKYYSMDHEVSANDELSTLNLN
jgi:capsular exopolysaccharide synthesis family protein